MTRKTSSEGLRYSRVWYEYHVGRSIYEGHFPILRSLIDTYSVGDRLGVVYLENAPDVSRRKGYEIEGSWVQLLLICLIPPPLIIIWLHKARESRS